MRFAALLSSVLGLAALSGPALAHPHVWVRSKAVVVYGADGRVTAVRHGWTFDPAYSAYAVQGFPTGPDGKPDAAKMAELAKINMESLAESGFFTRAKANGAKLEKGELTLSFELPLEKPAKADRAFTLEVYDPTFFVDFSIPDGDDAIRLDGAPKGCALNVTRPKKPDVPAEASVSESFFSALSAAANYGAQFSPRVLVACP